ncbi:MAG: LAGLIDADG family homing endonuclease [Promethearchaeota archaeon]
MKGVKIHSISQALDEAGVWHRIQKDFICTKKSKTKIPEISDKVAYFAGVVAGDGNLNKCQRRKGGYHYRVKVVGRKNYLKQLSVLVKDLFDFQPRVLRDKRKKNCYAINIQRAAAYFFFNKLGFQSGKKQNMRVPSLIAKDPFLFKHYMFGLIDTDGSLTRKRVQLKQRDKNFLKELVRLLKKHFDIISRSPRVNYTDGKPYYYIRFPISRLTEA